jgi:hypothetical protein
MIAQSLVELLQQCTVRLSVTGGQGHGTGFFVAPKTILTCAHVVKGANSKPINVWWQNQSFTAAIARLPEDTEKVDLALLELRDSIPTHSYLYLDQVVELGDRLYSFGYTDEYPNGDSSTFEHEGFTGDNPPLIKFKAGQVRPGLSGSPLLNQRTGKICGIVKRSRDRSTDLGGRAVPTKVIFSQFLELAEPRKRSQLAIPPNPFIPLNGRVDALQLIFGREKEIQRIFEVLNSGSSVALIGEEGIGKSSVLYAICQEAQSHLQLPRQVVFLDLNEVHNEDDFYSALCYEIGISESRGGYQLTRNLRSHTHKVLLALDNLGKITGDGFTRQVRDQLRGLAEGSHAPLKLILVASEPLKDLFNDSQNGGKTSPLAGICQEENIKPWNEATARAFIANRLAPTPIRFTEEEISGLLEKSRGHPRLLTQLCHKTYERYR